MNGSSYSTENRNTPSAPLPGWVNVALCAALAAAAASASLWRYGRFGLLGHDSYPLIASSRAVWQALTQPLMQGFYPDPFWRPVVASTFTIDHALWGLRAFGYHATDAAAFGLAAFMLALLARRIAGGGLLAPLVTLIAFAVHPTHVEVLPVSSRRGEPLCCAFLALALWLELSPRQRGFVRRRILPACATLLAIGSKETGFIAVPLIFVATYALATAGSWRERAWSAADATLAHAIAAALMLLARIFVLGSIGGHDTLSIVSFPKNAFVTLFTVAGWLVAPQPVMLRSVQGLGVLALLGVTMAGAAWIWASRERPPMPADVNRIGRGVVVAFAWIAAVDLIYAAAGWLDTWYALLAVGGWALLLGLLAALGARLFANGERALRAWIVAALIALVGVIVWHGVYSPLFRPYREWAEADVRSEAFFEETRARLEAAEPGDVVQAPELPMWVRPRADRPTAFGAAVLADYSVQAWADLALPERGVVVARSLDPNLRPAPGKILLRIPQRIELH